MLSIADRRLAARGLRKYEGAQVENLPITDLESRPMGVLDFAVGGTT
jgi:hypothetical protein